MGKPWKHRVTLADLILTTLFDEGKPMSVSKIGRVLKKQHWHMKGNGSISSAVYNLKKQGLIETAGFSEYRISDNEKARIALSTAVDKVVDISPVPDQSNAVTYIDPSVIEKPEPEPEQAPAVEEPAEESIEPEIEEPGLDPEEKKEPQTFRMENLADAQDEWKTLALELIRNQQRTIELLASKDTHLIIHGEKA